MKKTLCDWRNADNREGAHGVVAVRLGRGKGYKPLPLFVQIYIKKGETI